VCTRRVTNASRSKYEDNNYQLIQDMLDFWIPATNYGVANLSEGTLGLFGCVLRSHAAGLGLIGGPASSPR
jgi:hypothetical protein